MTRLLNLLARLPQVDWEALRQALPDALGWSEALRLRTAAGFPLLAAVEGSEDLKVQCESVLASQDAVLRQVAQAAEREDLPLLESSVEPMQHVAIRAAEVLGRLRDLADRMPRFSDLPLLNDLVTLALNQVKGKGDFSEDLLRRMPPLREFLRYLRGVGEGFGSRHPERADLADEVLRAVQALEHAAGGLFVYLQETRDPVDLSQALSLLDRGILSLGPTFQAMREVEYASLVFSENPLLDRLARSIQSLQSGEDALEEVERHLAEVVRFHRTQAGDVAFLATQAFMPLSLRDACVPRMVALVERMDAELGILHSRPPDPLAMAEAVNRFQALGTELDSVQEELEKGLAAWPKVAGAGHWEGLAAVLYGVYAGSVTDARLQAQVQMLLDLQGAYRRRLFLEMRRDPEEAERMQRVVQSLDEQQSALALALEYLESGDRDLLLKAYEALGPPTLRLLELKREAEAGEMAAAICPGCHRPNPPGSLSCASCSRPLDVRRRDASQDAVELFEADEPGSAALAENFRFLVEVLEDASAGVLAPQEARELLAPLWDTVVAAERQAHGPVRGIVAGAGDPDLASYQEELTALVAYLKETLSGVFSALEHHRPDLLPHLADQAVEVGEALARFNEEVGRAATPG